MKATMNDRLSSLSNVPICPKLEPTVVYIYKQKKGGILE